MKYFNARIYKRNPNNKKLLIITDEYTLKAIYQPKIFSRR